MHMQGPAYVSGSPGAGDWSTAAAPKKSYLPGEVVEAAEVMGAHVLASSDEESDGGLHARPEGASASDIEELMKLCDDE